TVIHAFDRVGRVEPHQRVVIQGAGPLGLFATAVANHAGVSELIVVGAPARRLGLAKRWGASAVVSVEELPTAEARLARVRELTGGLGADVVFELSGAPYAFAEGLDFLRPGGRYAPARPALGELTGRPLYADVRAVPGARSLSHARRRGRGPRGRAPVVEPLGDRGRQEDGALRSQAALRGQEPG